MKYSTYLFDFDYTLADSSRGIVICFRNVLTRHGHTSVTDEEIKRTIGKTLEDSFSILSGITDSGTLASYKKEYVKEANTYMTINTKLFPETVAVLSALKAQGAKIGIISTKFRYRILETLNQYFPKNFFDIIIGGEDVKQAKPDPQGIKKALRRLHRQKKETLYIGDSTVDAETAQRAGVDFVGVLNGMTTCEELAAYPHRQILDNLTLLPLVNKFIPYQPCKYMPDKVLAYYKLLHQKQIRGKKELRKNGNSCKCKNCGNTFTGNHCPDCGQNRNTPRFTLRNAFQNILSGFFNIDNGFSRNLLELLYRPGYMIRDYLDGKRVHYFKPFQSLFVLAALYIMAVQLIDPEALKKAEKEELTYESLMDDIKLIREEATNDSARFYMGQSLIYTDKARESELNNIVDKKLNVEIPAEVIAQIQKEVKSKLSETDSDSYNKNEFINDIMTSLGYADSLGISETNATEQQAAIKKQIKKQLRKELAQNGSYNITSFTNDMVEARGTLGKVWDTIKTKLFGNSNYLDAIYNLMKSWVHGNKAFSILALLPIFTFATRWSLRKSPIGRRFNLTEYFFAQVFIASQILWISLLILPFTGQAHLNDVFDLDNWVIFFLFVWNYRQLFNLSWKASLWRTIVMFWYCTLILVLISTIIISILVLIAYIAQSIA